MSKTNNLPKITKTASGKFHATVNYYTAEGKRSSRSFTNADKSRLVLDILAFQAEEKKAERMTLGDAIDRYLEIKSAVLSPSTLRNYRLVRNVAYPDLMGVYIDQLTTERIQIAVNTQAMTASPKTVRNHYGLVTATLAVYRPDFHPNVRLPQKTADKIRIPTTAEIRALLDAAKGTEMELPVIVACTMGLRRSELCALTPDDIDTERGVICITKALVKNSDRGYSEKPPKTATSAREVKAFPWVMEKLNEAKNGPLRHGRLFVPPDSITRGFGRLCKRAGVAPFRFHDLRHYAASAMLGQGFPKSYAASILGHDSERMLDQVYGHIMMDVREELEERLSIYFQGVFANLH
jgi:integrase